MIAFGRDRTQFSVLFRIKRAPAAHVIRSNQLKYILFRGPPGNGPGTTSLTGNRWDNRLNWDHLIVALDSIDKYFKHLRLKRF